MEYFAEAVAEGCHCEGDEEDDGSVDDLLGLFMGDEVRGRDRAQWCASFPRCGP